MTDLENLKSSYTAAIQCALLSNANYHDINFANDLIHILCKIYIDRSNYADKEGIKREFELLKETLSQEIKTSFAQNENIC